MKAKTTTTRIEDELKNLIEEISNSEKISKTLASREVARRYKQNCFELEVLKKKIKEKPEFKLKI